MFSNGARLDDEIETAEMIGVRLHAARGSMSIAVSDGGLPPDSLVENEAAILCQPGFNAGRCNAHPGSGGDAAHALG